MKKTPIYGINIRDISPIVNGITSVLYGILCQGGLMNISETLYITDARTSEITRSFNPAPRKYGPWARQLYVLIYVFRGKGYLEVGGRKYTITEGQSFIIYPGVTVCYWTDDEDEWDYFWVDFNGELAGEVVSAAGLSLEAPVLPKRESNIYNAFSSLVSLYYSFESNKTARSKNHLALLGAFYTLISEYALAYGVNRDEQNTVEKIVEYISANFSDPTLTADKLADKFGLSRTGLYRLFRERLNTTPKKHINNIRIENACTILHRNDRQIKDIALSVGFNDPLYFSKVFKERNGVSPSEYFEYYHKYLK